MAFEPHLTPLLPTPSRTLQKLWPKSLWPKRSFSLLPAASGTSVSSSQGQATGFSHPSPQPQVAEILFWVILQRGQFTKIEEENRRLGQCYQPTRTKRRLYRGWVGADRAAEKAMIKQLSGTDEAAGWRSLSGLQVLIKQLTAADQLADRC